MGFLIVIGGIALAIAQLVAGYQGIEYEWGTGWAWAAIGLAVVLRFTLPLAVGSFFGAMHVWGWHWAAALALAVPGLLFMIPGVVGAILETIRGARRTS